MKEITAQELKHKLEKNESFTFLDVREEHERFIADIESIESTRIPFHDLSGRLNELDPEGEIIVMCRSGNTAADACKLLEKKGFKDVKNLKGGINRWAKEIDTSIPVY
ncbi:MAG: rhodanese-like domain-containing protein [Bacteroidetes bacterium]|jgi:rhodanese-related sulfurtransferase|nr:rhodanese-like domain-containing protein [Bacteroidota bacterium]